MIYKTEDKESRFQQQQQQQQQQQSQTFPSRQKKLHLPGLVPVGHIPEADDWLG